MTNAISLDRYKTVIFDCDGVVLDSNKIKTEAFYQSTLPYGEVAAKAMVNYHISNGGISRFKKFEYFLENIAYRNGEGDYKPQFDELLVNYATLVKAGLRSCSINPGLSFLRTRMCNSSWLIVSGGEQAELREVFSLRGIDKWFDGGIYGSPDSKDQIIKREINSGAIKLPSLFFGDSKYDHDVAKLFDLDFIFVSGWTEVADWKNWVEYNKIIHINLMEDLTNVRI